MTQVRRGTKSVDKALADRERAEYERLSSKEFTKRQRFRDTKNNVYATPRKGDRLYKWLRGRKAVTSITDKGMPRSSSINVRGPRGTIGKNMGRALLYARMPRDGKIRKWPTGKINLIDPENGRVYTARVDRSFFRGRIKSGYVVVRDFVDWGRAADSSKFPIEK